MSDARWIEVTSDIEAAVRHFRRSVELHHKGGFEAADLDGYQAQMALMHALQSAHPSLEAALLRILEMLSEERPVGDNWHADLIKRVAIALPGKRPAILREQLASAADETRRFRHRAVHNYEGFRLSETARSIAAAELLARSLEDEIHIFRRAIDPAE